MKLSTILENYSFEELIKADNFDDAVVGIEVNTLRLVYSIDKMIVILTKDDEMTYEDAIEYLDFNVFCAYVGERTPIYIYT
jgi:hypothetical protein